MFDISVDYVVKLGLVWGKLVLLPLCYILHLFGRNDQIFYLMALDIQKLFARNHYYNEKQDSYPLLINLRYFVHYSQHY